MLPENNICHISTLPKAGTWYTTVFFWTLLQSLKQQKNVSNEELVEAMRTRSINARIRFRELEGRKNLHIFHSNCPGFEDYFKKTDPEFYKKWQELNYSLPYNWGQEKLIEDDNHWEILNPDINRNARTVYLYRNPFDHFLSYFNHAMVHKDESHRFMINEKGEKIPITTLHQFIFDFGMLDNFIKQYLTFKKMAEVFPGNIIMLPYEELTNFPEQSFRKILEHFSDNLDIEYEKYIENSLSLSSKENLASIENIINNSLANDLLEGHRHIKSGKVGGWMDCITKKEGEMIIKRLEEFDIIPNEFYFMELNK